MSTSEMRQRKRGNRSSVIGALGLASVLALPLANAADDDIGPKIPPARKGERCVEPTDVMRRDHMDMLMHQRDETVHEGIRTRKHSLEECLECHVPPKTEKTVRIDSREHFCNSCHSYAAVEVDCFQCHAEQPSGDAEEFHPVAQHRLLRHAGEISSDEELARDVRAVLTAEETAR